MKENLEKVLSYWKQDFLVKNDFGWVPISYIWNDEQTNAYLKYTGHTFNVSWISEKGKKNLSDTERQM